MLPLVYRLPLRTTRLATQQGSSYSNPHFNLKVAHSDLPQSRFAFLVSKKVSPLATQRNLLRRRLTAILLPVLKKLNPGYDVIIYTKKSALEIPAATLNQELLTTLTQAKILSHV